MLVYRQNPPGQKPANPNGNYAKPPPHPHITNTVKHVVKVILFALFNMLEWILSLGNFFSSLVKQSGPQQMIDRSSCTLSGPRNRQGLYNRKL